MKLIDKTKWKTFKAEKPKVGKYIYVVSPKGKSSIFGKYYGGDSIYEEEGFYGKNVKFKSNWLWITLKDYEKMEREFYENLAKVSISDLVTYENLAKVSISDLVTTIVRKVITQHLSCDSDSTLFWDGRNEFGADEDEDD